MKLQKPEVIAMTLSENILNIRGESEGVFRQFDGLHIAVRAGFSVENLKRATMFKFTNKFQMEAFRPPDGNMFVKHSFMGFNRSSICL